MPYLGLIYLRTGSWRGLGSACLLLGGLSAPGPGEEPTPPHLNQSAGSLMKRVIFLRQWNGRPGCLMPRTGSPPVPGRRGGERLGPCQGKAGQVQTPEGVSVRAVMKCPICIFGLGSISLTFLTNLTYQVTVFPFCLCHLLLCKTLLCI